MFNFNFFKSAPEAETANENAWNSNTVAMQQPSSPAAPSASQIVSEQPVRYPFRFVCWNESNDAFRLVRSRCSCAVVAAAACAAECKFAVL